MLPTGLFGNSAHNLSVPEIASELIKEHYQKVHSNTPEGYFVFYSYLHNRPCPKHARRMVRHIYAARAAGKDWGIEAFRGSTKTTTITVTYLAYQLGLFPHLEWAVFQAGDDMAHENMGFVADIIANNPGWKVFFGHVVPDPTVTWGDKGYELKRTDLDYGEWRRLRTKDPSFVGYGYKSKIIGHHPRGGILIDDIHDEENSASDRELQRVKKLFSGTIIPMANPTEEGGATTPIGLVGTPWTRQDVLMTAKASQQYRWLTIPARDADGVLAWPEMFSNAVLDGIQAKDLTAGKTEFPRMYLLDLVAGTNRVYRYQPYPADRIGYGWPTMGGVDYASVADPSKRNPEQSHFALAYLAKTPEGGAVVRDGVLVQCSQAEAENYVVAAQGSFPNWLHTGIETDGKGEDFYQLCFRNPGLRVAPYKVGGRLSKADRLYRWLGPPLQFGRLRISDAETPFLNALRRFLSEYPNVSEHDPGWDAADSVVQAVLQMPDTFMVQQYGDAPFQPRHAKVGNPFAELGVQTI